MEKVLVDVLDTLLLIYFLEKLSGNFTSKSLQASLLSNFTFWIQPWKIQVSEIVAIILFS